MIHKLSDVQSTDIGENTNIWQYCVILPDAKIGANCNICSHCFIENDVVIGNNVTIKNGVYLYDGIRIEDNVFIGPNATFCNDKYPKSKNKDFKLEPIVIKKGASIGANATILPRITIGEGALIAAGAIVTEDVKENSTYISKEKNTKIQREHTNQLCVLEADINNIVDLDSFGKWLEKALEITSDLFGKSSAKYLSVKLTKKHYALLPLDSFNSQEAIEDAREIITICYEGL